MPRIQTERQALRPSPQSLRAIDDSVSELAPADPSLLVWHRRYAENQRLRLAVDLDMVAERVPRTDRVIEFGSVPLILTAALTRGGYRLTGCDLAPERYADPIARLGLEVVKCDIETERLPFPDASFDAALFNELFEHLRIDPIRTMSEVLRVLRPGGALLLSTPNLRSLGGIRNFVIGNQAYSCSGGVYEQYRKVAELGHMGHVREYTAREVVEFLEAVGFRVHTLIYRGRYHSLLARTAIRLVPALSPFVSYVAVRPEPGP